MEFIHTSRPSPIAGTWYSGDPDRLKKEINQYIDSAVISTDEYSGRLFGIVVPHAGLIYSGKTAGYAYRLTKGIERDIVVVLSPFHQYHPAGILTTAFQAYTTPLGKVPVATDLLSALQEKLLDVDLPIEQVEQDPEHALEIQLPFLQCTLQGDYSLLPLMIRTRNPQQVKTIAAYLTEILDGYSALWVASTDLSHFNPLEEAQQLDAEMLRRIKAMDAEGVLSADREGNASACGASAVAALLYAAKHRQDGRSNILNYRTSADTTGDAHSVVGYGAAAVLTQ